MANDRPTASSRAAVSPRPTLMSRIVKWTLVRLFELRGYKLHNVVPTPPKCVILGAPHTTNWDFVFFTGATYKLGIRPRFMGKHTLFQGPQRRFMFDMGGVPVDRSTSGNYVDQVVDQFASHDDFCLVIAPEGTRRGVTKWRTGFYHIAVGAGVPVAPAWVDDATKDGGVGPAIAMTGNFKHDIGQIAAYYKSVMPDNPRLQALYRMAEEAE